VWSTFIAWPPTGFWHRGAFSKGLLNLEFHLEVYCFQFSIQTNHVGILELFYDAALAFQKTKVRNLHKSYLSFFTPEVMTKTLSTIFFKYLQKTSLKLTINIEKLIVI
jgi:hypothetical protein